MTGKQVTMGADTAVLNLERSDWLIYINKDKKEACLDGKKLIFEAENVQGDLGGRESVPCPSHQPMGVSSERVGLYLNSLGRINSNIYRL